MNNLTHKGIVLVPSDFEGVNWVEKLAAANLNTLGMHSGGGAAHDVRKELKFMREAAFRKQLAEQGLDYEYEIHCSHDLIDHALAETHPEYFPADYRRRETITDGNWCVSNPEALKLVVENALRLARDLPSSTHRYFFWGVDRLQRAWCHCPKCAHLSAADQVLITANAIAERITEVDPQGMVCYLAYQTSLELPRHVKPHERVFMEFAPYFRCYHHAFTDNNCAVNVSNREAFEKMLTLFAPEKTHILEYWLDSSLYGFTQHPPLKPIFVPELVESDIRYYCSLGIKSITTFAVRQDGEYMQAHGDREFQTYAEILNKYL